MEIEGFEGEKIKCSQFTEKVGNNYIDYKFEYNNNLKIIEMLNKQLEKKDKIINFMAEWFEEWAEFIDKENYYTIFRKMSKEDIKEYFKKKVEE